MRASIRGIVILLPLIAFTWAPASGADLRRTPIVEAVERASPAVVNISSQRNTPSGGGPGWTFPSGSPLEDFFKDFIRPFPRNRSLKSLGSGVIVDPRGFILTNEHVVQGADKTKVTLSDGRQFQAMIVGADPPSDLAILRIYHAGRLPVIQMGTSSDLMIGETVIAIGNPFGLSHTVTTGVISALNRSVRAQNRVYHDFIQTDAAINPGNSGGPLLNIQGRLIGINTAIYQRAQGVGFAIPIDRARRIMKDLISYGEVHPAWIGIEVRDHNEAEGAASPSAPSGGAVVWQVTPGGPAHKAGIREGDIVLGIDEDPIRTSDEFYNALSGYTAGSRINMVIFRNGRTFSTTVKAQRLTPRKAILMAQRVLGMMVSDITPKVQRLFPVMAQRGVVVTEVMENGPSGTAGIRPGDVLLRINEDDIHDMGDFSSAMVHALRGERVKFLIQRGRYGYYLTMNIGGR